VEWGVDKMIKDAVGSKIYTVWVEMLKRLVPHGRTHRLSVVVAGMLWVAHNIALEKKRPDAKAKELLAIFESAYENDEENGVEPLLKVTEDLFRDAEVRFNRANSKGQGYSIAEETVHQFLNWEAMPWEG
jgi:hypothetical protein